MSKKSNLINMNNSDLKKLSKSELIKLLLKQNARKPMDDKPVPKPRRPVPTPRKSVKDMVQQYEDNIISPPPQFRDDHKPIPLPRTKKLSQAPIGGFQPISRDTDDNGEMYKCWWTNKRG